jgi:hypothetical protein
MSNKGKKAYQCINCGRIRYFNGRHFNYQCKCGKCEGWMKWKLSDNSCSFYFFWNSSIKSCSKYRDRLHRESRGLMEGGGSETQA